VKHKKLIIGDDIMKSKLISKAEAISLIKDGDTVAVSGFVGCSHPEDLTAEIEKSYLKNQTPKI
jgi:propionate CoA-transferase